MSEIIKSSYLTMKLPLIQCLSGLQLQNLMANCIWRITAGAVMSLTVTCHNRSVKKTYFGHTWQNSTKSGVRYIFFNVYHTEFISH